MEQGPRKATKSGGSKRRRLWRAREREPITGVWAEPPAGSSGRAPGQGVRGRSAPEAEKLFAFRSPLESANLLLFSLCCRLSKLLNFQSNIDSGGWTWQSLGFAFTT